MGNSCNHEHEEELRILFAARGGEEDICQNIFRRITVISSYLEFKGYSAVPD